MSNEEKKSCFDCAYRRTVAFGGKINGKVIQGATYCRQKSPSFNEKDLENNVCEKFLLKKTGMTLEEQHEEQKQEKIKKRHLAEQVRITKENNKLPNRLKRNWKTIVGIIGVVASIATIVELYLLLIRY
jgi:hypothetical protein